MLAVGAGDNHLPLIYVRDVVRGILLAAETEQALGRSYVLVNDEPVTQRDFLETIAGELGVPAPKRHLPYRLALTAGATAEALARFAHRRDPPPVMRYGLQLLGGDNRFVITRARDELGFDPLVDLAEGVRRTVAWYRTGDERSQALAVAA
jgi:nucleoside-diphosphate-sugar epimerase